MVGFVLPLFEDSLCGAAWWLVMALDGLWSFVRKYIIFKKIKLN